MNAMALNCRCLLAALALLILPVQAAVAQSESATPSAQLTVDDLRKVFERLVTASDNGDRKALIRFSRLYPSLYQQALIEASSSAPKIATAMIPELDSWLADKAQGGSATAQFWMAERTKVLQNYRADPPDIAEVARWYRASAEQGFAPAQAALGQVLGFFPEIAREPFEAEAWLFRAVQQGEPSAAEKLLQAIDIDAQRAAYKPSAEIMGWLKQRAAENDATAQTLLDKLAGQN